MIRLHRGKGEMKHRILLTVDIDREDKESAIILVNDILTANNIFIVDVLPRCPFDQYPYGQSCCKQECLGEKIC